ncbi:hypothetical protein LP414_27360 [Polaromonas sp. P1(28)-13]|nr:hypothetical protein LP414_27360 [Polaromonas sp. P1(28)-13]
MVTEKELMVMILAHQVEQVKRQKLYRFGVIARQVQELAEKRLETAVNDLNEQQLQSIGWSTW